MSKKDKKQKKKHKKCLASCEHKSDKRTAEFVVRRLDELQEQICDLIPDLRIFEHYSEIEDVGWCLMLLQRLKKSIASSSKTAYGPNDPEFDTAARHHNACFSSQGDG